MEQNQPNIPFEEPGASPQFRTQDEVTASNRDLFKESFAECLLLTFVFLATGVILATNGYWLAASVLLLVCAMMFVQSYSRYRAAAIYNEETLGKPYIAPESNTGFKELAKRFCSAYGLTVPEFFYRDPPFDAEYDPMIKKIRLGYLIASFDTDLTLATVAHECAHHIFVSIPEFARKFPHSLLWLVDGLSKLSLVVALIGAIDFAYYIMTPDLELAAGVQKMSLYFSIICIAQLLTKGILTTHEYEVNNFVKMYLDGTDALGAPIENNPLDVIQDKKKAFFALKLGEYTYTINFAMWVVISLVGTAFFGGYLPLF